MSTTWNKQQRTAQQEKMVGQKLHNGEYMIEAVLGQGGMGQVFLATHLPLQVQFAIKQGRADHAMPEGVVIELDRLLYNSGMQHRQQESRHAPPESDFPSSGGTHTDRFLREVLLLARLQHPSMPALYDYFFEGGSWYMVMDYIVGPTLSSYMQQNGRLPPLEALNYALQLCDVLEYLHQQRPPVIYRDLKPANILLARNGRVMLVDFGIARYYKAGQENDTLEFGSPGYAPPEQYQGSGQTDSRSDLFSLGVILHEMLSGERPSGKGEKLESLHYLHPEISPILSGLVSVATRAEPMYRFQSPHTFYLALERAYMIEERREYAHAAAVGDRQSALSQPPSRSQEPSVAVQPLTAGSQDYLQHRERIRAAIQEGRRSRLEHERAELHMASVDESLGRRSSMGMSAPLPALEEVEQLEPAAEQEVPLPSRPPLRRVMQVCFALALVVFLVLTLLHFFSDTARIAHRQPTPQPTSGVNIVTETPVQKSSWQILPSLPSTAADNAAIYVQTQGRGYIYVSGGYRGPKTTPHYDHSLYRYDLAAAHWETLSTSFPVMVNDAVAQDEQGTLFYTAGYSPDLNAIPGLLYMYQPASGTLQKIQPPGTVFPGFGAALLADQHGHLYVTQGFLQAGKPRAQAGTGWYRYDLASRQWQTLAPLPVGLGYALLTLDGHGNILMLGGATDAGQHFPSPRVYRYNTAQNTWSVAQSTAPAFISGAAGCLSKPGQFVVVGGYNAANNSTPDQAWTFDVVTLQWTALAALPSGGSFLGAAACDGLGHVYLERGAGANSASAPTADFLQLIVRQ